MDRLPLAVTKVNLKLNLFQQVILGVQRPSSKVSEVVPLNLHIVGAHILSYHHLRIKVYFSRLQTRGNMIVALNHSDCRQGINNLLEDTQTYVNVFFDPTCNLQRKAQQFTEIGMGIGWISRPISLTKISSLPIVPGSSNHPITHTSLIKISGICRSEQNPEINILGCLFVPTKNKKNMCLRCRNCNICNALIWAPHFLIHIWNYKCEHYSCSVWLTHSHWLLRARFV